MQIKQLEEGLGVRLLDRNTRSVRLTRIGEDLAPVIDRLLHELESVVASAQALSTKSVGLVTVAALPSVSASLLPGVVAAFSRQYPGISFRVRDTVAKRIVALTKNGDVDFGIGWIDDADSEMRFEALFTDWMSVVFPADSKLERKKTIDLKDLTSYSLILTDRESSVRNLVDRAFSSIGESVVPTQEVTYMATAIGMVKAGLGVSILPSSALELEDLRRLKARPINHAQLHRTVGVLRQANRSLSPAAESFLETLRQACNERDSMLEARLPKPAVANCPALRHATVRPESPDPEE